MAPVKRKASSSPAPPVGRSAARLYYKTSKMTNKKSDAEEDTKQEAPTRAPRVQLPHACKGRLEELTRSLDFKTFGSTVDFLLPTLDGAKLITELSKELGYDNGGQTIDWLLDKVRAKEFMDVQNERKQLDWLLPTEIERLQELTRELGFQRGGQTVDWLLHIASKEFLMLAHFLGFKDSANTIQFLLDQAMPVIAARFGRHSASAGTVGYTGPYSSPANQPLTIPQFSQMPQGVTPNNFAGTLPTPAPTGVEGGNTTWYSSNPHTSVPTPTGGLGGGTIPTPAPTGVEGGNTTWYSSNPHTSVPTPTGGLGGGTIPTAIHTGGGGGSTAWYSSNPHTSSLSPTGELGGGTIPTPTPTGGGGSTPWYSSNPHTSSLSPTGELGGGTIPTTTPTGGGGSTPWYSSNPHTSSLSPTGELGGRGTIPTPTPTPTGEGGSTPWYSSNPHTSSLSPTGELGGGTIPTPTPTGGGGGSTPWYSSNPHTSSLSPTGELGGGTIPTPTPTGGEGSTPWYSSNPHTSNPRRAINTPTPAGRVEGGTTTSYSSNPHTSVPTSSTPRRKPRRTPSTPRRKPRPVDSSTRPVTAHRSALPMPNTYSNGFHGGQSQMKGDGQFQGGYVPNNGMFNSSRMMQPMSFPQSQQASVENNQFHNGESSRLKGRGQLEHYPTACTGNIVGPGEGVSAPVTPLQHSINSHPNHNPSSVHYGDRGVRVDQLQTPPQVNQLISQGSNPHHQSQQASLQHIQFHNRVDRGITVHHLEAPRQVNQLISQDSNILHEFGGAREAQNRTQAKQPTVKKAVKNGRRASNRVTRKSSRFPNPNPPQEIIEQVQAPADQIRTERRTEGHEANQLVVHSHCNGGQSPSIEFPIDIRCTQGNEETHMTGLPFMRNQTKETETQSVDIDEFENIETEAQTEKKQEANYFVNIETETEGNGETHMAGFPFMRNQILEINGAGVQNNNHQRVLNGAQQEGNDFVNIETETQTEKRDGNESGNIEIETQIEKKQQINEFGNIEIETQRGG